MACKYIINGKEFSESQVERIVISNLGLPSIKTRTTEQTIQDVKENTLDRFVNIDLFTPYQEMAYTRMLTSYVIDQLGVLKPGTDIKTSPTKIFLQAKALFENSRNKFDYLIARITTQETLDAQKARPEVLTKFPELAAIDTVEQLQEIRDQYQNVLDNFDRFKDQVSIQLRKYGLTIKANDFAEITGDQDEYYRSLIISGEAEEVEISDREIQEGFEDGNVFRINPRDTASTRVKAFFYTIPSPSRNIFGIREFVDYDTVIEDLLRTGSELEEVTYENLVAALQNKYQSRPYLKNVVARLAQLKSTNNTQLLNEILTFVNKAFQEQTLILWDNKTGAVSTKVIKSNRNSVIRQITADWLEQQKSSDIIIRDDDKELMINTVKVKELKESLQAARTGDVTAKKKWTKEFLRTVGVDFTDDMIDDFQMRADKGFFRKDTRNTSFAQLFENNNLFDNILDTYGKVPTGTTESKYEDVNNGMKDEGSSFNKLAEIYYDHSPGRYQTGNFQNGEGKSIYSYIQPSYLENLKRKLKSSEAYLDKILGRSFSRSSEAAERIRSNIVSGNKDFTFEFTYMDSLKKDKKNSDGVTRKNMSNKEQLFDAILKHQNAGSRLGYYNLFTLSDKTTTPVISISKYILNDTKKNRAGKDLAFTVDPGASIKQSFSFKQSFKNELFRLAEAEINRMIDYANQPDKSSIDIKNFDKAYRFFYLFPVLNRSDNPQLNAVKEKIFTGQTLQEADKDVIKEVLAESFKQSVENSFHKWVNNGIVIPQYDEEGSISGFVTPLFDGNYLSQKELQGLNSYEKVIYSIADLKFNSLRAQINALQLLGADPALFFKMPKTGVDVVKDDKGVPVLDESGRTVRKTFEQYTDREKLNIVLSTMDEFSKRAAMFIAPGSQGTWSWTDSEGNFYDKTSYNTITLSDFERDTELFSGVNVTDAQEFVTLQEHIDRMMSEGKIPLEIWQSINDKLKTSKGQDYTLSKEEKQFVLQPTKPVYTNNTDIGSFPRIDYVKSSTYVLIPEILAGTELDKLRQFMETNDVQSAAFESAKKVGQPNEIVTVFDKDGNFVDPGTGFTVQSLDREGLHTQMEIPYQKDEITTVSQMNRTLFDGLLDSQNFAIQSIPGIKFSGREFKKLKENVRINLFRKAKKKFMDRFGVVELPTGFTFSDKKKLVDLLREEAISQKFSLNDINSIKLDESGELVVPLFMMARSEKFEGMLNSLISKIVRLKNPGTSLVQVSAVATKLSFSELSEKHKSEVIWSDAYDPQKGLQYMRKEKGVVKPAQVIISQYLRDANGKLIDLSEFVIEEDGLKFLDTERINPEVLQLVGSRIPNQGHPSMLPIEVIGFLPSYMESTLIVPDGITTQMGSDFDVDKLYAYTSVLKYIYSKEHYSAKEVRARIAHLKSEANKYTSKETRTLKEDVELSKLQEKIEEKQKELDSLQAKSKITSIGPLRYKLDYDGSPDSLDAMSVDELNQLYKDIHWAVLTHPDTFEKITKSIDFDDVKNEVALLDSIGLYHVDPNIMPFDFEQQIQVFNDNKGGKTGVSIFASLGSFLADNQDKDIFLGYEVEDDAGNIIQVKNPIKILSPDGRTLELYKVTGEGKTGSGKSLRTKGDNNSIVMTESVDNAKNKNMYRFNWHPKLLSAVQGFISLSTDSGEIHDITFATRLFPQQILQEYAELIENGQDSLSEFQEDVKAATYKKLFAKYFESMSPQAQQDYTDLVERAAKDPDLDVNEVFSAERLLDLLKTSVQLSSLKAELNDPEITEERREAVINKLDDYYRAQIGVLNLFNRLDEVGSELATVIGASYIYTKGIGSNIFSVTDNIRKLGKLVGSNVFLGLEQLAGRVDNYEGIINLPDPIGEIGHSIKDSLFFAKSLYKEIFPVHFSSWFLKTSDIIFNNAGINKERMGSEKYIRLHKRIFNGVRSFLFSSPTLEIFESAKEERQNLLIDSTDNQSLGTRILQARKNHPELLDNYFVKRLEVRTALKQGDPTIVRYKAPFSDDIDELANNRGFLELILSGKEDLINIAKDLVKYAYVTGGNETSGSFQKFIPIEYMLSDQDYVNGLKTITDNLAGNGARFIRQFVQNNPDMVKSIRDDEYTEITKRSSIPDEISIPRDSKIEERLTVPTTLEEAKRYRQFSKLPDYIAFNDYRNNQVLLFQRQGDVTSNSFRRINTLGTPKSGFTEYQADVEELESVIYNNMTATQKLSRVLTNPNNVFQGSGINLTTRIREIAMADVSTKFIGKKVPGGTDTKSYIDIVADVWKKSGKNNTDYSDADTIMVIGSNAYTLKPNKEYISAQEIEDHFNSVYKPYIDKAINNGSKFTVGYYSGMDEVVRKYLKANGYNEVNSGLGYGMFTPRGDAADQLSLDDLAAMEDGFDNVDAFADMDVEAVPMSAFGVGALAPSQSQQAEIQESEVAAINIYHKLGNKTVSDNVVIHQVYQKQGVEFARSIGGIFSLRLNNSDKHFGNPFSHDPNLVKKDNLIQTSSTQEAVEKYIDWVLNSPEQRAVWIREQLQSGILKNKPIVYYKELGEPSHATALDYLINKYQWNDNQIPEQELPDNLNITVDPEAELLELIDPNDLISFDADNTEVDLETLNNTTSEATFQESKEDPIVMITSGSLARTLDEIYSKTGNEFYKNLIDIYRSRKGGIPDVQIYIDPTIEHPGLYKGDRIIINPELAKSDNPDLSESANLENVLMHEITHAYTANIIVDYNQNKSKLSDRELIFVKALDNLFKQTVEQVSADPNHAAELSRVLTSLDSNPDALSPKDKSLYYGLTNLHEFASMMLTDNGFQQFMNSIVIEPKTNKSVFDLFKEMLGKLLDSLAKALGISIRENSVLDQGISNVISMISSSENPDLSVVDITTDPDAPANDHSFDIEEVQKTPGQLQQFDPYKIKTPRGVFEANDDQKIAIDKIADFFSKPVTENFDDNIFLLYGAGGTGKTAVSSNAIKQAIKNANSSPRVGFAAVTHTAKGELRAAGNKEAKTLASMLGAFPKFEDGVETFELVPYSDLLMSGSVLPEIFNIDWLVIDEASMLGTREREMLQQRIADRGRPLKILFMGDHVQIPPVGEKPDQDGFAINLRKDQNKSVQLTKIERTKNRDIADLGAAYRRAVDYYNQVIEATGSSSKSNMPVAGIVPKEKRVSSENIFYTSNKMDFVNRFIDVFRKDPLNPRNAIIITYNNEKHTSVIQITNYIRKTLFGAAADQSLFLPGEPISIKSTITVVDINNGKEYELGTNERVFIKDIFATRKRYKTGKSDFVEAPVYQITAYDKFGNIVRFDALDKAITSQFTPQNYDKAAKGYRLSDGTIFKYADKKRLEAAGLTDIYHSYMVSGHKVQGQTYNYPFVAESNIAKYVNVPAGQDGVILTPKSYAQIVYTAVSRAREKVFVLSDVISPQQGSFEEPVVTQMTLKSVTTTGDQAILSPGLYQYDLKNQCN